MHFYNILTVGQFSRKLSQLLPKIDYDRIDIINCVYICIHLSNHSGPYMLAAACTAAVGSAIGTAVGVSLSVTFVVAFSMGVLVASVLGYISRRSKNSSHKPSAHSDPATVHDEVGTNKKMRGDAMEMNTNTAYETHFTRTLSYCVEKYDCCAH